MPIKLILRAGQRINHMRGRHHVSHGLGRIQQLTHNSETGELIEVQVQFDDDGGLYSVTGESISDLYPVREP